MGGQSTGQGSISLSQKQVASGPPFVASSADNGLSVDPVTRHIVLGNDVGAILATLLSNREIPFATFFIRFLINATSSITFNQNGAAQLIQAIVSNAATLQGLNIEHTGAGAAIFTGLRTRNASTTGFTQLQVLNDALNGLTLQIIGSAAAGANVSIFTVTGTESRFNVPTAAAFHRWFTQNTQRMVLLANGRLRLGPNNTDNTASFQASGPISGGVLVVARNITPYNIDSAQDWGAVFTNEGAGATIVFNLPTAIANYMYEFIVRDVDGLQVKAAAGDTIRLGAAVSAAAGTATSTVIGSAIRLVAINATEWVATSIVGTWVVV